MATSERILFLTRFSILLALEAIVCFTPLGSIPLGPGIVATLGMVPVIVTAIVMGPKAGSAMGAFAGLFSFLVWTFMAPGPGAFVFTPFYSLGEVHGNFWSLVIVFVPRILVGTVAGLVFQAMERRTVGRGRVAAYGVAGLLGSLTNTVGVLGGIYFFFGRPYAEAFGMGYEMLLGAIGLMVVTNGIPEAIVSTVIASVVCQPLRKLTVRRKYSGEE